MGGMKYGLTGLKADSRGVCGVDRDRRVYGDRGFGWMGLTENCEKRLVGETEGRDGGRVKAGCGGWVAVAVTAAVLVVKVGRGPVGSGGGCWTLGEKGSNESM